MSDTPDQPPTYFQVVGRTQTSSTFQNNQNVPLPSYNEAVHGLVPNIPESAPLMPQASPSASSSLSYGWNINEFPASKSSISHQSAYSSSNPSRDYSLQTVVPFDCFKADLDANELKKSLDICDKDTLINLLCQRSYNQRLEIASIFQRTYGLPLSRHIKNQISKFSNFSVLMCGLTMPLCEFFGRAVHNSHSYRWMCFIMITLPDNERALMKNYYDTKYRRDMIDYIKLRVCHTKKHPDKHIITQILRVIQSLREEDRTINESRVESDVAILQSLSRDNTNKELAKDMFYNRSFTHLAAVTQAYLRATKRTIDSLIDATFSRNAFVINNIILYAQSPSQYFAYVLHQSMKGFGTNEILLSSAVLMRCEVDMVSIKQHFYESYGKTLREWIRDDTSGHYKYALYKLIGEQRSNH